MQRTQVQAPYEHILLEQACYSTGVHTSDGSVVIGKDKVAHTDIGRQVCRHKEATAEAGGIGSEHDAVQAVIAAPDKDAACRHTANLAAQHTVRDVRWQAYRQQGVEQPTARQTQFSPPKVSGPTGTLLPLMPPFTIVNDASAVASGAKYTPPPACRPQFK